MPTTEMCFYVSKTTDKTCFSFTKRDLSKDWGPIDQFKMIVDNQTYDGIPCFLYEKDYAELRR